MFCAVKFDSFAIRDVVEYESFAVHAVACYRCPAGQRLFPGSMWCENIDECAENTSLCYYGTCRDKEDGYMCECDPGYYGPTCREQRDTVSIVVSSTAQLVIAVCAFLVFSKNICPSSVKTDVHCVSKKFPPLNSVTLFNLNQISNFLLC